MDIIDRTLAFAKREDRPVIVVYQGKKGISQRRVYVRGIAGDKITAVSYTHLAAHNNQKSPFPCCYSLQ